LKKHTCRKITDKQKKEVLHKWSKSRQEKKLSKNK